MEVCTLFGETISLKAFVGDAGSRRCDLACPPQAGGPPIQLVFALLPAVSAQRRLASGLG